MRLLTMPMSAKLMERWFNGQLNYSKTDKDEKSEINQSGVLYPPSMIDTTSITMKWVLGFTRAKNDFDTLTESRMLENPAALDELARKLNIGRPCIRGENAKATTDAFTRNSNFNSSKSMPVGLSALRSK